MRYKLKICVILVESKERNFMPVDVQLFTVKYFGGGNQELVFALEVDPMDTNPFSPEGKTLWVPVPTAEILLGIESGSFKVFLESDSVRDFVQFDFDNLVDDGSPYLVGETVIVNLVTLKDFLVLVEYKLRVHNDFKLLDTVLIGFMESMRSIALSHTEILQSPYDRNKWAISTLAEYQYICENDDSHPPELKDGLLPHTSETVLMLENAFRLDTEIDPID